MSITPRRPHTFPREQVLQAAETLTVSVLQAEASLQLYLATTLGRPVPRSFSSGTQRQTLSTVSRYFFWNVRYPMVMSPPPPRATPSNFTLNHTPQGAPKSPPPSADADTSVDGAAVESDYEASWLHAAARAISGGPVYVSDRPGQVISRPSSDRMNSSSCEAVDALYEFCRRELRTLSRFPKTSRVRPQHYRTQPACLLFIRAAFFQAHHGGAHPVYVRKFSIRNPGLRRQNSSLLHDDIHVIL